MTVSYGSLIATVKYGSFFRLLFRWRGSLYKLVWPGFLVYCCFYAIVAIAFHSIPNKPEYRDAKTLFVQICYIASRVTDAVPISFVLAFYVNLVVGRWLQQFNCLPTPDAICLLLSTYLDENPDCKDRIQLTDGEERALVYRRTISRYVNLASALCFCSISISMKQRFPTLDSLVLCGLMTEQELEIYSKLDESTNNFFVPLVWAISLIARAHEEKMIREERHVDALITQVVAFWEKLHTLCMYDWVNVPLVYNQVVTLAVYIYFTVTIFGHQFVASPEIIQAVSIKDNSTDLTSTNHNSNILGSPVNATDASDNGASYPKIIRNIPIFTILSFIFYNGWLKVAESLVSPFGLDDDDFEVVPLLERNLNTSLYFVDTCITDPNLIPELVRNGSRRRKISTKSIGAGSRRSSFLLPSSSCENYLPTSPTFESIVDSETPWPVLPPARQRRPSHTAFIGSLAVEAAKDSDIKSSYSPQSSRSGQGSGHLHPDTLISSVGSSFHRLGSKIKKISFTRSNTPVISELDNHLAESVYPTRSNSITSSQGKLSSKDA
ncbi:Bestrophin-4 [Schistosoma japonicum]|uniref:Bestrophin homolog n=1 Tax=Schistosoma japonicum TaxID=6182 RepID=A0A4Z2D3Z6_SCHJA|nr:Bestrophin-4 [Schistosoma japonicum]